MAKIVQSNCLHMCLQMRMYMVQPWLVWSWPECHFFFFSSNYYYQFVESMLNENQKCRNAMIASTKLIGNNLINNNEMYWCVAKLQCGFKSIINFNMKMIPQLSMIDVCRKAANYVLWWKIINSKITTRQNAAGKSAIKLNINRFER